MIKKEELAKQYAEYEYCSERNDTPRYRIAQIHAAIDGYIAGWDEALKNQWIRVEEQLPKERVKVLVLTTNKKITISFRYTPKDIYGKVLGNDEWQGSSALNKCIIAWMPIPSFDEILETNKDVLKRLKYK